MNNILATLEAVDQRLAFRNGEIIGAAFRNASISCYRCSYPENAEDFSFWLSYHVTEKIELHRATKRRDTHHNYCLISDRQGGWRRDPCAKCNEYSQEVYKWEHSSKSSHDDLKNIWPCSDCIELYNPTARINHSLRNQPELKGFLDVRFD